MASLLTHSRKRFWKFCITRCSIVGEIAATSSMMFCFKFTVVLGFFSYFLTLVLEKCSEEEVLRLEALVPMNIEVPTKYQLSHNDRIVVFENHLRSKNPMLYRPALNDNWNALSLARRALKDKFPTPTVPLTAVLPNHQLFLPDPVHKSKVCKIHVSVNILIFVPVFGVSAKHNFYFPFFSGRDVVPSMQNSWHTSRNTVPSLALNWRMATRTLAACSRQRAAWQNGKPAPLCYAVSITLGCTVCIVQ